MHCKVSPNIWCRLDSRPWGLHPAPLSCSDTESEKWGDEPLDELWEDDPRDELVVLDDNQPVVQHLGQADEAECQADEPKSDKMSAKKIRDIRCEPPGVGEDPG